jgi:hypothetical protein
MQLNVKFSKKTTTGKQKKNQCRNQTLLSMRDLNLLFFIWFYFDIADVYKGVLTGGTQLFTGL